MTKIYYKITLVSDAEPGSGFGTNTIDSMVPRNAVGVPYIPSAHLKGLMRENFLEFVKAVINGDKQAETVTNALFGGGGTNRDCGFSGSFNLSDAQLSANEQPTALIARTALNQHGTAEDKSLRVSEAIATGSSFNGTIRVEGPADGWQAIAVRLALTSVMTLGAGRNRGAGACHIETNAGQEAPGNLLLKLQSLLTDELISSLSSDNSQTEAAGRKLSEQTVLVKLTFKADGPICCPELPVLGNNAIKSGFAIPASAVQGALLTKINASNPELATALFESSAFRLWPLLPTTGDAAFPIKVSQTHKISKDGSRFLDLFLHQKPWEEQSGASPLKGVDGVLLQYADYSVKLLRSADMPRFITAHGVHSGAEGERNLFTVESMAPNTWSGIAAIPQDALDELRAIFEQSADIQVGRARTVRGGGKLTVSEFSGFASIATGFEEWQNRVFIVQSPIALPDALGNVVGKTAEEILAQIVQECGWGEVEECSASIAIRFGWNRHAQGRQDATAVITPGSVFKLKAAIAHDKLQDYLVKGVGEKREHGYGAVLPHPGEASELIDSQAEGKAFDKHDDMPSQIGYNLWEKASGNISASQVAALVAERAVGLERAMKYLDSQLFERPAAISDKWKKLCDLGRDDRIAKDENGNPTGILVDAIKRADALDVFKVWNDLIVGDKEVK